MARQTTSRNPKVNLTKYVQLSGKGWRYCPVLVSPNGRVKPDFVLVDGKAEQHKEGTYSIEWYADGKRHRQSVGRDCLEAQNAMLRQQHLLKSKMLGLALPDGTDLTRARFSDAATEFLNEVKQGKRPKTYVQYEVALRYFAEFRNKRICDIERRDLLDYMHFLRDTKLLSRRTVWTKINVVVQFLKTLGVTGLMKKKDWPQYVEPEPEIYTDQQLLKFFASCNGTEQVIFDFFLTTGLRDQEVQHVCKKDIDLAQQVVRITEKPQWGFIPKDWEQREVPIPDRTVALLKSHLRTLGDSQLVFPTSGDLPDYHFLPRCKRIAWRAGLNCGHCETADGRCSAGPYCREWFLHKFRATFATMHLQSGVDLCTVQHWMGHKDLASTMRYLKPARGKDVADKVNRTFERLKPQLVRSSVARSR
jgi:integrase/recombinase XerD